MWTDLISFGVSGSLCGGVPDIMTGSIASLISALPINICGITIQYTVHLVISDQHVSLSACLLFTEMLFLLVVMHL